MNIEHLYNELAGSIDNFKLLLSEPCSPSPAVAQQLLLLTAELVKAIEFDKNGESDYIPNCLTDNIEESRVLLEKWLDTLKASPNRDEWKSEEFRRQHEQTNYRLYDFLKDPHTLMAVMGKHIDYEGWFKRNFPNGAESAEEVISKLNY